MKITDIEEELMDYVRSFDMTSAKRDSSGYAEKFIGFKDDVLWVYGHKVDEKEIKGYSGIKKLIVSRIKQDIFDEVIKEYHNSVEQIFLWKAPLINDFSCIENIPNLKYLTGFWNNNATSLWEMRKNAQLICVSLRYFSKITSFSPMKYSNLMEFEFSGNSATSKKIDIMDISALKDLPKLKSLLMSNIYFPKDAVDILSNLHDMGEMYFSSNAFTTEEFARLAAKHPGIQDNSLGPYWEIENDKVVIVGKGKPILDKKADREKMNSFVNQYNEFIKKYK